MTLTIERAKQETDVKILAVKEIITAKELMAWYSVTQEWIKKQIINNGLPYENSAKGKRFSKTLVDAWFRGRMVKG